MRQKELRIGLVCYGGISLAVYMHGVTKELWKLARASRAFHAADSSATTSGTERVYLDLLRRIQTRHGIGLRVLPDIIAGASAGGINGVFLAQAIHSGESLEPLTALWLERADVDVLLDPAARPSRMAKFWARPLVRYILTRPGNVISASVAPETRAEVRIKFSRLIRSRWFAPPFGGLGFSRLLGEAFDAMKAGEIGPPLLPPGHPLDLFVTATDFNGRMEKLRLHSPAQVEEGEHRLSIGFRATVPAQGGDALAPALDLIFAARATASFPGAFPPLQLAEIDALARERHEDWTSREAFTARVLGAHVRRGDLAQVSLIDGSVLVNAPFAEVMGVLSARPAQREVDRRFVYIDPRPTPAASPKRGDPGLPGFFTVIFGAMSAIPREQPIRDNLEMLERQSREMARLSAIVRALRPEVEAAVEHQFGRTLFFDRPTVRRLTNWRAKAMQTAVDRAGFAYHGYAQLKFAGIVDGLARLVESAAPEPETGIGNGPYEVLTAWLAVNGLGAHALVQAEKSSATLLAVAFFRQHDIAYRIRRLRLMLRRLSDEDDARQADVSAAAHEAARDAIYQALSHYFERESSAVLGNDFPALAAQVRDRTAEVLDAIAASRQLAATDLLVDALLAKALAAMPQVLRRRMLLTYLGFPFYDIVTLPLLRGEGLTEYDPVKVDRISPEDAPAIRDGGAAACLRGVEFFNFGAFFSRAYRENDYLWGRLHGAERMIDLLASALPEGHAMTASELTQAKRAAFLAILEEEEPRL
ncbi:MAG: patatin-like protein, partial [Pseudomonadota bacterium]|nr:patatin-like protein [Pseudomonadota bacterium]